MATKETRIVPIGEVFADYGRNVRQAWKYKVTPKQNFDPAKDTPGFFEDVFYNGIRNDIEVVELTEGQQNLVQAKFGVRPKYRVFRGHRRFKAASLAHEMMPEKFETLSVTVFVGLSERDEIRLMCDHSGTEPLNEYEEYESVVRLYGTGLSQEEIGVQIGRGRAWVQDRIYILELCGYIPGFKDNYATKFEPDKKAGEHYVAFTMKQVDDLHKLWGEDTAANIPSDSPNSKTMAKWREISTKTVKEPAPAKALTRSEMDKRSGLVKGRDALEIAHRFYNGDGGNIVDAVELYDALVAQANKVPALEAVIVEHEAELKKLRSEIELLKANGAALQSERDTLAKELSTIRNNKPAAAGKRS